MMSTTGKMKLQNNFDSIGFVISSLQNDIVRLDVEIKAKFQDIKQFNGNLSGLNKLTYSIKERQESLLTKMDELEQYANEIKLPEDREKLLATLANHRASHQMNLQNLRSAQLVAMQKLEKQDRSALFAGGSPDGVKNRRAKNEQSPDVVGSSAEATDGLAALLRTMGTQVKQSQDTLDSLVSSSQTIGTIETESRTTGGAILSSGKLLSKYSRRELTDKILICLALLLFFGTAVYIVKKRTFGSSVVV